MGHGRQEAGSLDKAEAKRVNQEVLNLPASSYSVRVQNHDCVGCVRKEIRNTDDGIDNIVGDPPTATDACTDRISNERDRRLKPRKRGGGGGGLWRGGNLRWLRKSPRQLLAKPANNYALNPKNKDGYDTKWQHSVRSKKGPHIYKTRTNCIACKMVPRERASDKCSQCQLAVFNMQCKCPGPLRVLLVPRFGITSAVTRAGLRRSAWHFFIFYTYAQPAAGLPIRSCALILLVSPWYMDHGDTPNSIPGASATLNSIRSGRIGKSPPESPWYMDTS
jgi:hypothetical protein